MYHQCWEGVSKKECKSMGLANWACDLISNKTFMYTFLTLKIDNINFLVEIGPIHKEARSRSEKKSALLSPPPPNLL